MGRGVHLFLHSHWDIQWYLSRSELRYYLFREVRKLIESLESGRIPVFTFDGQVMPLLDFLEAYPEYRGRVSRLVREGRLEIGPWVAQPDNYLVNGESIVRNLALGIILSESLGGVLRVGYLPDSFGHQPQIPQILRGAGIKTYMFQRGYCWDSREFGADFIWRSPDGSEVVAFLLVRGYCGGIGIGLEDIYQLYREWSALSIDGYQAYSLSFYNREDTGIDPGKAVEDSRRLAEDLAESYRLGIIPFPIGCDQYMPRRDLIDNLDNIVKGIREGGVDSVSFGLKGFQDLDPGGARDKLNTYSGELRCPRYHYILWGVPSTRVRIKQLNFTAERLVQRYLEPLSVFMGLSGLYFGWEVFRDLWIKLIRTQFHDSICGTVTDHVALNVEAELGEVIEASRQMIYHYMAELYRSMRPSEGEVLVFNPSPYRVKAVVELTDPRGVVSSGYRSVDVGGSRIPLQRVEETHPLGFEKYIYVAEVPPMALAIHRLSREEPDSHGDPVRVGDGELEGGRIALHIDSSGRAVVRDRLSGAELSIEGIVDFVDRGDVYSYELEVPGSVDLYRFRDPEPKARGPLKASLRAKIDAGEGSKPGGARIDRGEAVFSIYSGVPVLDLYISFRNVARDHVARLRIVRGDLEVYRDLAYMIDKYSPPKEYRDSELELEPRNAVFQYWFALRGRGGGFIVVARGLRELFVYDDYVEVTLLRSVGSLSRGDLQTRRGHAGPPLETPGAQDLYRDMAYRLTIVPFTEDEWGSFDFIRRVDSIINPPIAFHDPGLAGGGKDRGGTPAELRLVEVDPPLMISALKPVERERGSGYVVRVYNPTPSEAVFDARSGVLGDRCRKIYRATIDERVIEEIAGGRIAVKPFKIETIVYDQCGEA